MKRILTTSAGVGFCLIAATLAWYAARLPWNAKPQLSALTLAIIAGLVVANSGLMRSSELLAPGIRFSQQKFLRLGIILYGLRLTVHDLVHVGPGALAIDLLVIGTILLGGYWFGTRILRMDGDTTLLVCAGSGICGAAAVLATDRVIESESHKVSAAVATVVVFGTIALFLYPMIYSATGFGEAQFGVYIGSTVHEVAHVVAAGRAVGTAATDTAVVTKMLRVLLLAPVLVFIGQIRKAKENAAAASFPWFVLGFGGVIVLQSMAPLHPALRGVLLEVDTILLASAMFALGLGTRWTQLKRTGPRPLVLGAVLFGTLMAEGFVLTSALIR